jgi:hypothetical protein
MQSIIFKILIFTAEWSQPDFLQKPDFKTFPSDIFLDIYKCPFLKISVDFLFCFNNFRINQLEHLKKELWKSRDIICKQYKYY